MQTHQVLTYSINELSESAKEKALDEMRINWLDYEWYDSVYDDAKTIGALMGIDIDHIWFSGFSSQGDGACFEGSYSYKKGSVAAVKAYAPQDKDLHDIVEALAEVQKRNFYQVSASIRHSGHYYHAYCTSINVDRDSDNYQGISEDDQDAVIESLRDFMNWIYARLENEYEYQLSDEVMTENCIANEYQFTENGEFYV